MDNSVQIFTIFSFRPEFLFWVNLVQKIKIVSLDNFSLAEMRYLD